MITYNIDNCHIVCGRFPTSYHGYFAQYIFVCNIVRISTTIIYRPIRLIDRSIDRITVLLIKRWLFNDVCYLGLLKIGDRCIITP
jgi:uncharacterized membrane protein